MLIFFIAFFIACASKGPSHIRIPVYRSNVEATEPKRLLKVMTLNLAHGRATGFHQILTPSKRIEQNLRNIADFLQAEAPTILALQEADGPSFWSGRFDHVRFLADEAKYPYAIRGSHILSKNLDYGTAILSALPLSNSMSHSFTPSPPMPTKGFVYTQIQPPNTPKIHVISLHLDFARQKVREEQLQELVDSLEKETGLYILLGDFNTQWSPTIQGLCRKLNLKGHRSESQEITFPKTQKTLDWILVSREISFLIYEVHKHSLSDHHPVSATLRLPALD